MRDAGRPTGRDVLGVVGRSAPWSVAMTARSRTDGHRLPEFAFVGPGSRSGENHSTSFARLAWLPSCRAADSVIGVRGGCRVVVTPPCVGHQVVVLGPVAGEDDAEPGSSPCSRHQSRTAWEIVWSSTAYRSAVRTSPRQWGSRNTPTFDPYDIMPLVQTRDQSPQQTLDVAESSAGELLEVAEDVRLVLHVVVPPPARRRRVGGLAVHARPASPRWGAGVSRPPGVAEVGALAVHAPPGVAEVGRFVHGPALPRWGRSCRCRRRCRPRPVPGAPPGADPLVDAPHPPPGDLGVVSPGRPPCPQAAWTAPC